MTNFVYALNEIELMIFLSGFHIIEFFTDILASPLAFSVVTLMIVFKLVTDILGISKGDNKSEKDNDYIASPVFWLKMGMSFIFYILLTTWTTDVGIKTMYVEKNIDTEKLVSSLRPLPGEYTVTPKDFNLEMSAEEAFGSSWVHVMGDYSSFTSFMTDYNELDLTTMEGVTRQNISDNNSGQYTAKIPVFIAFPMVLIERFLVESVYSPLFGEYYNQMIADPGSLFRIINENVDNFDNTVKYDLYQSYQNYIINYGNLMANMNSKTATLINYYDSFMYQVWQNSKISGELPKDKKTELLSDYQEKLTKFLQDNIHNSDYYDLVRGNYNVNKDIFSLTTNTYSKYYATPNMDQMLKGANNIPNWDYSVKTEKEYTSLLGKYTIRKVDTNKLEELVNYTDFTDSYYNEFRLVTNNSGYIRDENYDDFKFETLMNVGYVPYKGRFFTMETEPQLKDSVYSSVVDRTKLKNRSITFNLMDKVKGGSINLKGTTNPNWNIYNYILSDMENTFNLVFNVDYNNRKVYVLPKMVISEDGSGNEVRTFNEMGWSDDKGDDDTFNNFIKSAIESNINRYMTYYMPPSNQINSTTLDKFKSDSGLEPHDSVLLYGEYRSFFNALMNWYMDGSWRFTFVNDPSNGLSNFQPLFSGTTTTTVEIGGYTVTQTSSGMSQAIKDSNYYKFESKFKDRLNKEILNTHDQYKVDLDNLRTELKRILDFHNRVYFSKTEKKIQSAEKYESDRSLWQDRQTNRNKSASGVASGDKESGMWKTIKEKVSKIFFEILGKMFVMVLDAFKDLTYWVRSYAFGLVFRLQTLGVIFLFIMFPFQMFRAIITNDFQKPRINFGKSYLSYKLMTLAVILVFILSLTFVPFLVGFSNSVGGALGSLMLIFFAVGIFKAVHLLHNGIRKTIGLQERQSSLYNAIGNRGLDIVKGRGATALVATHRITTAGRGGGSNVGGGLGGTPGGGGNGGAYDNGNIQRLNNGLNPNQNQNFSDINSNKNVNNDFKINPENGGMGKENMNMGKNMNDAFNNNKANDFSGFGKNINPESSTNGSTPNVNSGDSKMDTNTDDNSNTNTDGKTFNSETGNNQSSKPFANNIGNLNKGKSNLSSMFNDETNPSLDSKKMFGLDKSSFNKDDSHLSNKMKSFFEEMEKRNNGEKINGEEFKDTILNESGDIDDLFQEGESPDTDSENK